MAMALVSMAQAASGFSLGLGFKTAALRWLNNNLWPCGFKQEPATLLDSNTTGLQSYVVRQDWALDAIVKAFESHRLNARSAPLSMLFVGTTGVGKTFSAIVLAELIQDGQRKPLILHGENYHDDTYTVPQYRRQILTLLHKTLSTCKGQHVVVVDEVQKMNAKTLDVFTNIIEAGEFDYGGDDDNVKKVDCRNAV
jgi:ATP-dependent Clp protease ATP-binding subunit ClpA